MQVQLGWSPEEPGLVEGVPDILGDLELDGLKGSFQPKAFSVHHRLHGQQAMYYVQIHITGLKKTSLKNTTKKIIAVAYIWYEKSVTLSEILVIFPN